MPSRQATRFERIFGVSLGGLGAALIGGGKWFAQVMGIFLAGMVVCAFLAMLLSARGA